MEVDDSFKKPGSVPFKWEIQPGVPKLLTTQTQTEKKHQRKQKQQPFPEKPAKLKPPPAGLCFQPPIEPRTRTRSAGSSPRTFSYRAGLAQPDVVSSARCFPSSLGKLKNENRGGSLISLPRPEYYSDLETSSRWSFSSRKSVSPSIPVDGSSPRPVFDAEWAGFGLF